MKNNKSVSDDQLSVQAVEIFTDVLNMSIIDFLTVCAKNGINYQVMVSALSLALYEFTKVALDSKK